MLKQLIYPWHQMCPDAPGPGCRVHEIHPFHFKQGMYRFSAEVHGGCIKGAWWLGLGLRLGWGPHCFPTVSILYGMRALCRLPPPCRLLSPPAPPPPRGTVLPTRQGGSSLYRPYAAPYMCPYVCPYLYLYVTPVATPNPTLAFSRGP